MKKSAFDRAAALTDGALGGFRKAHVMLMGANEILTGEREASHAAIATHTASIVQCDTAQADNQRALDVLSSLLGGNA